MKKDIPVKVHADAAKRSARFFLGLLVLFALTLIAAPSASADPAALAIHSYEEEFGVSAPVAEKNLETQEEGAGIPEQLMETQGRRYAGVWFDNHTGEFVVPTLTDSTAVAGALRGAHLEGDFRTVPVRFNWDELEAAQEELDLSLQAYIKDQLVQTFLDPRTNSVVVLLSTAASGKARAAVQAVIAADNALVEIREAGPDRFRIGSLACDQVERICPNPLRGGVAIGQRSALNQLNAWCTAGFKATGNTFGNRFILTAGHCGTEGTKWGSANPNNEGHYEEIGPVEARHFPGGDWEAIKANGSSWDWSASSWPYAIALWGKGESELLHTINSESGSYVGQWVCHSGFTTGTTCGYVKWLDVTVESQGELKYHQTAFEGSSACGDHGDSGGPVYAGNTALGIFSGGEENGVICGSNHLLTYAEITEATDSLQVTVGPRVGAPPGSETLNGVSFSFNQATVSGAIDPNGIATNYYVQFGTTSGYGKSSPVYEAGSSWYPSNRSATVGNSTPLGKLKSNTVYHYRFVAQNSAGTSYGEDKTFTTPSWSSTEEDDAGAGPRAILDSADTLHVFYRDRTGNLGHRWLAKGSGTWVQETITASIARGSVPHAILDGANTLHVFFRETSGNLGHDGLVAGGGWIKESLPASMSGDPNPILDPANTLHVFFRETSGKLGHYGLVAGSGSWVKESLTASIAGDSIPRPILDTANTLHVFYRETSGNLGHYWLASGAGWVKETITGSMAGDPRPIIDTANTLHVFFRETSGNLGHDGLVAGGGWIKESLPASIAGDSTPHPILDGASTLHVFYRQTSGNLGHYWLASGAGWVKETITGSMAGDPRPIIDTANTLHVFFRETSGNLGHDGLIAGGGWIKETLPASIAGASIPRPILDPASTLHVFYRETSGNLGHYGLVAGSGSWVNETLPATIGSRTSLEEDDASPGPRGILDGTETLHQFFRETSGNLGHYGLVAGGGGWIKESLPASIAQSSVPHAILDSADTLHVFFRETSGNLGHYWLAAGGGGWHKETITASMAGDPRPIVDSANTLHVFFRETSGNLGHYGLVAGGGWIKESLPASMSGDPNPILDPADTLHVFYRDTAGNLGHYGLVAGSGSWSKEALTASIAQTSIPRPILDTANTLHVFYRETSGNLGHYGLVAGTGSWSKESLSATMSGDPHPILDPADTLHVFYRDTAGNLGHYGLVAGTGSWSKETLTAALSGDPHPILDTADTLHVFYREPSGNLGHYGLVAGTGSWVKEPLSASMAAKPPLATTGEATEVGSGGAKVAATIDAEGSPTDYYFEYGPTVSYGSKAPLTASRLGNGLGSIAVSEALSGLAPTTTYHYRILATSPEGTTQGQDKTFTTTAAGIAAQLSSMAVTEPFDGSSGSLANFSSKWSTLGWATGTMPKGEDTTSGWRPVNVFSTVNGAYYNSSFTDSGSGLAAVGTMATNPGSTERYFSLWLDMQSPAGTRAGYELRFTDTATDTYTVKLSKWVGGSETPLSSKTGYSFVNGKSLAIVDQGGTVSAWTDTGSGFTQLLSAADSTYSSGYAGLNGAGNTIRLSKFKVGGL